MPVEGMHNTKGIILQQSVEMPNVKSFKYLESTVLEDGGSNVGMEKGYWRMKERYWVKDSLHTTMRLKCKGHVLKKEESYLVKMGQQARKRKS